MMITMTMTTTMMMIILTVRIMATGAQTSTLQTTSHQTLLDRSLDTVKVVELVPEIFLTVERRTKRTLLMLQMMLTELHTRTNRSHQSFSLLRA